MGKCRKCIHENIRDERKARPINSAGGIFIELVTANITIAIVIVMFLGIMLEAAFGGEALDANPGEKTYQDFLGYSYANASDANE